MQMSTDKGQWVTYSVTTIIIKIGMNELKGQKIKVSTNWMKQIMPNDSINRIWTAITHAIVIFLGQNIYLKLLIEE